MSLLRHWKIGICLVAIFITGAVTGAMVTVRLAKQYIARQATLERWTASTMKDYERKLALTPEQSEKLRPVFEQAARELREVRATSASNTVQVLRRMNEDIGRDLTPAQQARLDDLKREFVSRWRNQHGLQK
jgi:uncharacterized membrane protein